MLLLQQLLLQTLPDAAMPPTCLAQPRSTQQGRLRHIEVPGVAVAAVVAAMHLTANTQSSMLTTTYLRALATLHLPAAGSQRATGGKTGSSSSNLALPASLTPAAAAARSACTAQSTLHPSPPQAPTSRRQLPPQRSTTCSWQTAARSTTSSGSTMLLLLQPGMSCTTRRCWRGPTTPTSSTQHPVMQQQQPQHTTTPVTSSTTRRPSGPTGCRSPQACSRRCTWPRPAARSSSSWLRSSCALCPAGWPTGARGRTRPRHCPGPAAGCCRQHHAAGAGRAQQQAGAVAAARQMASTGGQSLAPLLRSSRSRHKSSRRVMRRRLWTTSSSHASSAAPTAAQWPSRPVATTRCAHSARCGCACATRTTSARCASR
jgi:hypothetical protein